MPQNIVSDQGPQFSIHIQQFVDSSASPKLDLFIFLFGFYGPFQEYFIYIEPIAELGFPTYDTSEARIPNFMMEKL